MPGRPLHILLVEDDEVDAEFIVRLFQRKGGHLLITVARNGLEALELLRGLPGQSAPLRPHLILTDLDMPRMNGIGFIREIRQDPELRRSIVFVLTSSALEADKRAAYEQQIAGYLLKTNVATNFSLLERLVRCYQEHVEFPP